MDIIIRLHGIEFEWDGDKAKANIEKHEVDFVAACEIFSTHSS